LTEQRSYLSLTKVTTIDTSSVVKLHYLNTDKLKTSAIGNTILEDVWLLSEGKLDLAATINRQVSISDRCTLTVYNRRTVLFIPGELSLVLPLSNFFSRLRLEYTTFRVLKLRLCPLECFFTILLQCFDKLGVQECRQ
jgi:hypothetical protein